MVKDRVAALNAKEAERLHQLELQKLKFKAELEAQMKANAYNRWEDSLAGPPGRAGRHQC